jgi:transmembrane sensor
MTRIIDLRDAEDRRLAEAARWQMRLAEADIHSTPDFEAWLREPGNRAAWEQVSAPWDYFDHVAHDPEMIAAREAALGDAKRAGIPVETSRSFRPWAAAIAAALLIAMTGGGYWWSNRPDDYRTAMGERRVVTLVDGSRLSLDSDSEVTVRYGSHARDLRLLRGQARFDVTHDRARPFSVVAGKQKVIATGTAFNIDMAGPKVLVTLIEGRVLVVDENDGSATTPASPPHVVELRAGQQMTTGAAGAPAIVPVNLQHVTAWTVGHIMFDDEPLSSVVERVNRYGGTQIVIADPQVGAMKISGVFNSGDVLGFVEIVTHYLPVRAVSEGTGTIALQSDAKKNGAL